MRKEDPPRGESLYYVQGLRLVAPDEIVPVDNTIPNGTFKTKRMHIDGLGDIYMDGDRDRVNATRPVVPRVGVMIEQGRLVSGRVRSLLINNRSLFRTGVVIEPGESFPLVCEVRFDGIKTVFKTLMTSNIDEVGGKSRLLSHHWRNLDPTDDTRYELLTSPDILSSLAISVRGQRPDEEGKL